MLAGNEITQLVTDHGLRIGNVVALAPLRQRGQVALVGVERVHGHAPLDLQVGQELLDGAHRRITRSNAAKTLQTHRQRLTHHAQEQRAHARVEAV
ncbi:hypothetical protein D3C81_811340 [compost metagenome]